MGRERRPVLLALGLNSCYLAARADASLFYFANVALHVALGSRCGRRARSARAPALAAPSAGPGAPRRSLLQPRASPLGLVLLVTGATRPFRPLLYAHIGARRPRRALALVAGAAPRRCPFARRRGARGSPSPAALLAARGSRRARRSPTCFPPQQPIVNPALPPPRDGGGGPGRTRGPSSRRPARRTWAAPVPSNFFMTSEDCARCHKDIYDQWNSSAHHFASFNNQWYRKSIEYMQDVVGTKPSKWCAGCHDHAVLFAGKFDTPIREQIDTPEAQVGLGCTVLPLDRAREEHDGAGRLHDRVPAAARPRGEREPAPAGGPRLHAEARPRPPLAHVPEELPHRPDAPVLRRVPQGAPRRAR